MNLERGALELMRSGHFVEAAEQLQSIVRQQAFGRPVLNDALTVALYRANQPSRLSQTAFEIGMALVDTNPAAAMDYFQRALLTGLGPEQCQQIGGIFERWKAPPPIASGPLRTGRVAHVVGCLMPGHAPSLYVQLMARALRSQGIESTVFTTEWTASWFLNPPGVRQSQDIPFDGEIRVGPVTGNFLERAERIALDIRKSGIDIVFYHASLCEQITARVAAYRPARLQINVDHAAEMDADLFEGCVHLFLNGVERTRFPNRPHTWIPLISDIEDRLAACQPKSRAELGLPPDGTVSATFGNLYKVADTGFLDALVAILRDRPSHTHVFAGAGNTEAIERHLRDAGVADQIRYLGHLPDVAPLLNVIDVYLNSFPHSAGQSILEGMAAGIPVVVLKQPFTSHYNVGAELADPGLSVVHSASDYVALAARLLADSALRRHHGERLQARFRSEFRPDRLGQCYVDFLKRWLP